MAKGVSMNKLIVTIAVCLTLASPCIALAQSDTVLGCDERNAREVRAMMAQMGDWSYKQGKVIFRWNKDWDYASREERLGLIKAFANTDACITGEAREIIYFRNGKRVGIASPSTGIKLVD